MSEPGVIGADYPGLDALLRAALELPPAQRDAFAESACGGHPDRLQALRKLLAHCADDGAGWERLPQDYADRHASDLLPGGDAQIPAQIGSWTVGQPLGAGGMATVVMATRTIESAVQRAAIKVLTVGRAERELRERFDRERRILARLSDRRIARFYDAGVLDDGRPWLAMEFVDGERIDHWCDARRLDIDGRMRLLIEVARAVASAHAMLIVHRDIKPSNILVGSDAAPRLLDFGIAKVLDDQDSAALLPTAPQHRLMTPQYASPEQLLGEPAGTASDVYQLGLLAHELCSGSRPFESEESTLPRFVRAVVEFEPPTLRGAFVASGQRERIAAARGTSVERLQRRLRGDLALVVAKALRREPAARYASAAQFADDLARCLDQRPVDAAAASTLYRARRFVARHRVGAILALLLVIALVGGTAATAWQARLAIAQRDQARAEAAKSLRLTEFLVGVFTQANPGVTQGATISAKSLLDAALQRIERELPQPDASRSDLLAAIASAYMGLGLREPVLPLAEQALGIERGLDRPQVLTQRLVLLASALRDQGQAAKALELLDEAAARLQAGTPADSALLGRVLYLKGVAYFSLADASRSEQALEESLAQLRAAPDARAQDLEATMLMLSRRWASRGDFERALSLANELVEQIRRAQPPRPVDLINALDALGSAYSKAGRIAEQVNVYTEALALAQRTYGPELFDVAVLHNNLALALERAGDRANALLHARQAVEIGQRSVGAEHSFAVTARIALRRLRCASGDRAGAADELAQLSAAAASNPRLAERMLDTVRACSADAPGG